MSEMTLCPICSEPVEQPETGRPRRYCGPRCKKAAQRARKAQEPDTILDIEAQASEPAEASDDVIDLDKLSDSQLREVATGYGVSPDGDREAVIVRVLRAYEALERGDTILEAETQPDTKPQNPEGPKVSALEEGPADWELAGEQHPAIARWQIKDVRNGTKRRRPTKRNETIQRVAW